MHIMSMKTYNLRKEEKQQILLIYSSAIIFCESTLQMSMGLSFLINFKCREFMEYFLFIHEEIPKYNFNAMER